MIFKVLNRFSSSYIPDLTKTFRRSSRQLLAILGVVNVPDSFAMACEYLDRLS
jgi:hypothetical protein